MFSNSVGQLTLRRFPRGLGLRVIIFLSFGRTIFIRSAVNDRLEIEIAMSRRAGGLPFQAIRLPGISPRTRPEKHAAKEVDDENDLNPHENERTPADEHVQGK